MSTYKTFTRSATNYEEFSSAKKHVVDTGLTQDEARRACKNFNDNRSEAEKEKGTKMEYTEESVQRQCQINAILGESPEASAQQTGEYNRWVSGRSGASAAPAKKPQTEKDRDRLRWFHDQAKQSGMSSVAQHYASRLAGA